MKFRMNWFKRVLAVGLGGSVLLGTTGISVNTVLASEITETAAGNEETVRNGTILQAFCWSFNTIKDNMADIAAAGYTAVQTSPINECESGYPEMTLMGNNGKWYYHYQPTDWKIGNYQLGTREEFRAMCDEADKYGIKIIVDILPNHTSVVLEHVSEDLIWAVGGNLDDLYHDTGFTDGSYSDRLECTYYSTGGLPDVDTENEGFQAYFFGYLKDCIACGADGFRIDTAKHIALPDDPAPEGVENSFYPALKAQVTDKNDLFVYGEVLQGGNERLGAYQKAIGGTTASNYGASIRTALVSNDYSVDKIQDYQIEEDADSSKLVTWVESHDNYLNDGTWSMLDETQIKLGWAIIGARKDGTPLFFSRPKGSTLSSQYGENTIGIAGSDIYKDDEIAAVNKFRTAMTGETENLRNPNGDSQVLMIERGEKGIVIVNGSYSSFALDSETNLADGTYTNRTDDNGVYTVSDGVINGVVPQRSVVVLYEQEAAEQTTVLFYNSDSWSRVKAQVNGTADLLDATSDGDGWWRVTVAANIEDGFTIAFTDEEHTSATFMINADSGRYVTGKGSTSYTSKSEAEEALGIEKTSVYFFNNNCWNSVAAYAWGTSEVLGKWPGVCAVYEGDYWWRVDVPACPSEGLNIIFNNNNNGSQVGDFVIDNATDVYTTGVSAEKYSSKAAAEEAIGISSSRTTVYFYNSSAWEKVYAYSYGNSEALGGWPGTAAEEAGDGWWKIMIPSGAGMDLHVIFNNNNGSQSDDFTISNIRDIYTTGKGGNKYASVEAAEAAMGLSSTQVTVYYYDTDQWDTTYAYAVDNTTNEEYLGAWPGTSMTEDWNGWQKITIPAGASDDLQVTFSNGERKKGKLFTVNDRTKVYLTGADETAYANKILAETALGVKLSTTTVHFYNSDGWEEVSAYLYGDLGEAFGKWPGTPAANDGDGWWSVEIPGPASANLRIIFNDNNKGHQSADYYVDDQSKTYMMNLNSDTYSSKEEAEAAMGITPGGNAGNDDTGDNTTGDNTAGDDNTGDDNTGDDNSGDDTSSITTQEGNLTCVDGKYYFYEDGVMAVSKEAYVNGAWRWFDADGTMAVDKDVYLYSSGGKWVRYNENGEMIQGEDYRYGAWYYFEPVTGTMMKGPVVLEDGRKVFYDTITGQMLKGEHIINGETYIFDENDGHLISGTETLFWVHADGRDCWYEDWVKQGWNPADETYRGKEIYDPGTNAWYWLDNVAQGGKAVSKDVYQESYSAYPDREDGTGKWVRYDENGHMVKGWQTIDAGTYYFEQITGAMAKGSVSIDGMEYYFDVITGIQQK